MRASRLLSILMLLQSRGRLSAQALADEVEVSVRTVYRDVDELSAAGVPVWADRGRNGGFQLKPGWRTRLDGLTEPEAKAMFLGGLPGPASQLGLGEAMASAQLKLMAALPDGWRDDARRVSSRFHLDTVDWYRGDVPADHLPAIAHAVWNEQCIHVRYDSWNGVVERTLEPLGLVLKAGIWYLAAGVPASGKGPRTYRVSNIQKLTVLPQTFARPQRFDLASYWSESTQRFEAELYRDEARLRVTARGFRMLERDTRAVADAARRSVQPCDEEGWVELTIPIESVPHAADQLLRLGTDARVLAPAALQARLRDTARRMAALYAGTA